MYNLDEYDDNRYWARKQIFLEKLAAIAKQRDGSQEDNDAFDNALEDFNY